MILILSFSFHHPTFFSDNFTNNDRTIGHMKTKNHSHIGQQNHHNLNTTNENDPLNYVIPIYSDTTGKKIKVLIYNHYDAKVNIQSATLLILITLLSSMCLLIKKNQVSNFMFTYEIRFISSGK